jgi:hypothetical protein
MKIADIRTPTVKAEREPSRAIIDHKGREIGHVGASAHEGAVSRILGHRNVKLAASRDGKGLEWRATQPPGVRTPPRRGPAPTHTQNLAAAKGSNKTLADVSAMGTNQNMPPPKIRQS